MPWTAALQAPPSFTISQNLLKLLSIESMMSSSHLTLCCPILLPSTFPSIRVFSSESALHIRWPKYWSFSFSINPSLEYSGLISFGLTGLISLLSKGLSRATLHLLIPNSQSLPPPVPWQTRLFSMSVNMFLLCLYVHSNEHM